MGAAACSAADIAAAALAPAGGMPSDWVGSLSPRMLFFQVLADFSYEVDLGGMMRRKDVQPCLAAWGAKAVQRVSATVGGGRRRVWVCGSGGGVFAALASWAVGVGCDAAPLGCPTAPTAALHPHQPSPTRHPHPTRGPNPQSALGADVHALLLRTDQDIFVVFRGMDSTRDVDFLDTATTPDYNASYWGPGAAKFAAGRGGKAATGGKPDPDAFWVLDGCVPGAGTRLCVLEVCRGGRGPGRWSGARCSTGRRSAAVRAGRRAASTAVPAAAWPVRALTKLRG